MSSWDGDCTKTWRQQAPRQYERHTQEPSPDRFKNLTPENSCPTTVVGIFASFTVAWGRTRLRRRQLVPKMMEPLVLLPLWIWDCLGAFSFQLQYANPYSENIQKAPIYFSTSLLRCLHREAIKGQFHGRRLDARYSKTKQKHRRRIEAAGGTAVATRVRGGTCVPAPCKQTASGHRALAVRTHGVLAAIPWDTQRRRGLQRTPAEGSLRFPKKAPFFNIENTRLAPLSGMHA